MKVKKSIISKLKMNEVNLGNSRKMRFNTSERKELLRMILEGRMFEGLKIFKYLESTINAKWK